MGTKWEQCEDKKILQIINTLYKIFITLLLLLSKILEVNTHKHFV